MKGTMTTRIVVQITDTAFPKTIVAPLGKMLVLGRSDVDDTSSKPDVDLINCNAIRNGISRNHAAIDGIPGEGYVIYDLGSRNGTFLNDEQLEPHQPRLLHDGDKVKLGRLSMTIFFE